MQAPQITYSSGKNKCGNKIYTLSQNEVCVQTNQGQQQQLDGNEYISLNNEGLLTFRKKYTWNGMTMYCDSKETMFPTLVHDALYQLMRIDFRKDSNDKCIDDWCKFKKEADKLFQHLCIENGVKSKRARRFYLAVRICGCFFLKFPNKRSYRVVAKIEEDVTAPANGSVKCR